MTSSERLTRESRRRITCLLLALTPILACLGTCGWARAPARTKLWGTSRTELLAAARAMMAAPETHGDYARVGGRRTRRHQVAEEFGGPLRDAALLPAALRELEPDMASVGTHAVTVWWDRNSPIHGYGYSLVLLEEGDAGEDLRRRDGNFCTNVELAPGIWSTWQYH